MSASVKIMLSYNYCHFEVCKGSDSDLTNKEINEMRKDVQRLADEAVRQFKKFQQNAIERIDGETKILNFEQQCRQIKLKNECDRTLKEIAMLKTFETENYRNKMMSIYDYEDEDEDEESTF